MADLIGHLTVIPSERERISLVCHFERSLLSFRAKSRNLFVIPDLIGNLCFREMKDL